MPHLFVAVTAHGYGHLAQVAPIVHALTQQLPALRLTLQGQIRPDVAAARLPSGFRQLRDPCDVALPMSSPLTVRWSESLALYERFDAEHKRHLARQAALFEADPPDLVLANVPWIPLLSAGALGIPAIALCSLNWHDILIESPIGPSLPERLLRRLREGYAAADSFLRPAPSMPMPWLERGRDIGPIAVQRPRNPERVRAELGIPGDKRLVLVLFGGTGGLPIGTVESLPANVQLLTPDAVTAAGRSDVSLLGDRGPDVLDVLASCDIIITKPGYGTFAEAACNGIPVIYVPRHDWPEAPHLVDWLKRQVPTAALDPADLLAGRIREPLTRLLGAERPTPVPASGIAEAVEILRPFLAE